MPLVDENRSCCGPNAEEFGSDLRNLAGRTQFDLRTQEIIMPLILWLLGVPLSVVVLLYLLGVV